MLAIVGISTAARAQDHESRVEVTASAWQSSISGTVQALGLPVALHSDLKLGDQWTFFGKLAVRAGRRHRLVIEGSPYDFSGTNTLSRTIAFGGRTYSFSEMIASNATLTYVFAGYQFDAVSRDRGHLGFGVGGAYVGATGAIRSASGVQASSNQTIGLPLAGTEFRYFIGPARLNINGEAKGMAFGGYGNFLQGVVNVGAGLRHVMFQAGYQYLNADIHENRATNPAGIAPVIQGPIFSIQLRR